MNDTVHDLLIIGAGPAGLTAALYGHRSGLNVLVLGGHTPGGQVTVHLKVENYPGFPGGVTGAELMVQWVKQVMDETGAMPAPEMVTRVDFSGPVKKVFAGERTYEARSVIVATGARPRRLEVPGESEFDGRGVFYCATCDAPLLRTLKRSRTVVVGGGNSAFYTALALIPHAESVTIITRGSRVRAQPTLIRRLETESKTAILTSRAVKSVIGDKMVTGMTLEDTVTHEVGVYTADAVFVGIGQSPVTDFLQGSLEVTEEGFIKTDQLMNTSAAGVFAAGDVRSTPLRQIITAAADGAVAAQTAAEYLRLGAG